MAKTAKTAQAVPASVSVRYNLLDLPTAQHKAGLAGLLLQVESLKAWGRLAESIPVIELKDATTVDATFSESSLRGLFDDLYDAQPMLTESSSRWPNATPVEEKEKLDPKTGKTKKVFVYKVVQPSGHFLRQFTDDGTEIWHKLWRDMLWAIPRGKPTTRIPFNNRASGKSSGEGEATWKDLLAMIQKERKNEIHTCEVAGAILLGAQALSAESVPFRDRVDHALLLHFWQLTARIFVPEQVDADGKREFAGYVLAVPEVADLRQFLRLFTRALRVLSPEPNGYRPAGAVISLPAQGALEFMHSLAHLAGEAASPDLSDVARALSSVEFFHMIKAGNNIKTMAGGRVTTRADLIAAYAGVKATCRNPVFLSARLLALLRGRPWYAEFADLMIESPWPMFVRSQETPQSVPSFAWDAHLRFEFLIKTQQQRQGGSMSKDTLSTSPSLETVVYRLVRTYVRTRTEQKSGITYSSFKDGRVSDAQGRERVEYPRAYTEAQEKVCSDLFLGLRSRRDDEFVSYFTGTVGSVPQGPNLSNEAEYRVIALALLDEDRRRDVQTLAMLAVSAASFAPRAGRDENERTHLEEIPQ